MFRSGLFPFCLLVSAIICGEFCHTANARSKIAWQTTHIIQAPEAVQAAAADETFAYAISSTQVAKYNRKTGRLSALSHGDAKHLNSGYLLNNQLYCAHSNYPATPEKSEIKLLDPHTMELRTFKDFGDSGGSLTWVVRHADKWWCHFAYYGQANAKSYLVALDQNWKETDRWTYPESVIQRLGAYSLSGGLWCNDQLWVTGHDDPIVFCLRLPQSGSVLELIKTEAVPFTGQGIAQDLLTGGLVGINRGRREIVFAAPSTPTAPLRLRVLTYNIHHAEGQDGKVDLQRIADVIKSCRPDLVALQEVDRLVTRSGSVDQPSELARLTAMHVAFGSNITLQGGEYGNVLLSRFPISDRRNNLLPREGAGEQRGALEVELELPGFRPPLIMVSTHFDHRPANKERIASVDNINSRVQSIPGRPVILAGDLNDTIQSEPLHALFARWVNSAPIELPTIPVLQPSKQIDFICVTPAERWKGVDAKVLDEKMASDHRPLLAVLELLPKSSD